MTDGQPAVGVGTGVQGPDEIDIRSIRHPGADTASSDPIRNRSLIVCPATLGPRFTVVLMYPFEEPPHTTRPASGLFAWPLIVPLYPPETKLPPTAGLVTSTKF